MRIKGIIVVKPGWANNPFIVEEFKKRIIDAGLTIVKNGFFRFDTKGAKEFYSHLKDVWFFPSFVKLLTSDKSYGIVVEGDKNTISTIRTIIGDTNKPQPGSLRYDVPTAFGIPYDRSKNVGHASDTIEAAEKEIAIFEHLYEKDKIKN